MNPKRASIRFRIYFSLRFPLAAETLTARDTSHCARLSEAVNWTKMLQKWNVFVCGACAPKSCSIFFTRIGCIRCTTACDGRVIESEWVSEWVGKVFVPRSYSIKRKCSWKICYEAYGARCVCVCERCVPCVQSRALAPQHCQPSNDLKSTQSVSLSRSLEIRVLLSPSLSLVRSFYPLLCAKTRRKAM